MSLLCYKMTTNSAVNRNLASVLNDWNKSQPAITCLKLTIEIPEQGVKYVQS